MPTKPAIIREVTAYRIIYKCGHRGVVVANERGKRGRNSARRRALALVEISCADCEQEELEQAREREHDELIEREVRR